MNLQDEAHNHPVLPRLRDDSQVKSFSVAGQWQGREASELEKLSTGLEVERLEFEINSIPDMWARPLLFEMALYDPSDPEHGIPGHLLHTTVLGEWRAFLTLLALRELRGIDALTAVRVQIPESARARDQRTSDLVAGRSQSRSFLDTLSKLLPSRTLASDTSWRDLYVFLFNGKAIGMTSPMTLVCTATEYFGRINNVPWFDGQILEDPTPKLSKSERETLASWLKKLKSNLLQHEGINRDLDEWEKLQGAIEGFIEDLGGLPERAVALETIGLGMTSGIFAHLSHAVRAEEGRAERSHVRLLPSREHSPETSILIVDERISEQWRIPPQNILVWGAIPLEAVAPYGALGSQRNQVGRKTVPGIEVWKPEEFFTEKLFVIDQKDAFPGTLKSRVLGSGVLLNQTGQPITPILPITKELVQYLSSDDLARRISFEQTSDAIKVRLELPLSGPEGSGKDFVITREYHFKDAELHRLASVPVLEIWPNFKVRDVSWNAYYTYYSAYGVTNTFYAEPYHLGAQSPVPLDLQPQVFQNNRGTIERRIARTTQFPDAVICEAQVPNETTNRPDKYYAGLLLIEPPQEMRLQRKTVKVGVDFGASNTNVYAKDGSADPSPVVFNNRFLQVTASGDRRAILYNDFLPGDPEPTPFLSVFHDFLQPVTPKALRSLLDGHIYYFVHYGDFDATSRGMKSDLKWSADPGDRIRAATFLEQLCLQASAEAVALGADRISWAFSFPTAFPSQRREDFARTWRQVIEACGKLTGLSEVVVTPEAKTESVASALFFKERLRANVASGAVCIDIGGSTSDIAVWHREDLQWQSSVRFAGRDMFLDLLHANPEFLKIFDIDVSRLVSTKNNRTAFYAQADALISREGKTIFHLLPKYSEDPQVKQFAQLIAVGLSGLFYYVGSVLQFLIGTGRYKGVMPDFYLGGNGARLFHWLAAGEYRSSSQINELFKSVLVRSTGLKDVRDFSVIISPHPKAEAAYGLVCDTRIGSDEAEEGIVAGETFIEDGKKRNWKELLNDAMLKKGLKEPEELERLSDFLATFDRYAISKDSRVSPVKPNDALMEAIKKRLTGELSQFKFYNEASEIVVEPIFVLALKSLITIKTKEVFGD